MKDRIYVLYSGNINHKKDNKIIGAMKNINYKLINNEYTWDVGNREICFEEDK